MKFDSKVFFQMLFRPAANSMAGVGITANQVTASTIIISIIAGTAGLAWSTLAMDCDSVSIVHTPGIQSYRRHVSARTRYGNSFRWNFE